MMTLPEGVQPSGPTEPEATVTPDPVVTEPVTTDPAVTVDEETPEEAASDAALRAWAKDNGIDGVPTSGRLSSSWRDQITAAMAAALDPKDEASVDATASVSSTSAEAKTMEEATGSSGEAASASIKPVQPEFEAGYRSVWQAPNTYVTSQAYTA